MACYISTQRLFWAAATSAWFSKAPIRRPALPWYAQRKPARDPIATAAPTLRPRTSGLAAANGGCGLRGRTQRGRCRRAKESATNAELRNALLRTGRVAHRQRDGGEGGNCAQVRKAEVCDCRGGVSGRRETSTLGLMAAWPCCAGQRPPANPRCAHGDASKQRVGA